MTAARAFLVIGVAVAAGGLGCSNADVSAPSRTARQFVADIRAGDGRAACALLSEQARSAAEGMGDNSCAELITDLKEPGTAVQEAEVWGDTAQVRIGSDVLFLRRSDATWWITAAGCTARPHRPYDCEVQA
ncbi:MAG TPA: hypothetical protein VHC49_19000 [Mycobacteriales bacterium]|nr:hypothetical protein [Mycobacteriales bacterium]